MFLDPEGEAVKATRDLRFRSRCVLPCGCGNGPDGKADLKGLDMVREHDLNDAFNYCGGGERGETKAGRSFGSARVTGLQAG